MRKAISGLLGIFKLGAGDKALRIYPSREAIFFGIFLFTVACISSITMYAQASKAYEKQLRDKIMRLTQIFSTAVDGDLHETFVVPQQENSPEYIQAIAKLRTLWSKVPDIRFLYTTRFENGRVSFVLDATPSGDTDRDGVEDHSNIGDIYEDPDPELVRALKEGKPFMSVKPYTDRWGTFLSGYVPIYNSQKEAVGVLGADVKLEEYSRQVWALQKTALYGLLIPFMLGLVLGFGMYFLRKKTLQAEIAKFKAQEELLKAKEAAEAASHEKSRFLANMSHEIRTPLNAILGFAEILKESRMNAEQISGLDTILKSGELLLEIINDILDVSKIEAGQLVLEKVPFSPAETVSSVVQMSMPKIKAASLDVKTVVHPEVPESVIGDPTRMRQIILNFLSNAVKFTQKGSITIEVKVMGHDRAGKTVFLRFSITDTGIGIPADKQKIIFEAFQQADSSTTRKYGGTGLGLAIVKNLVLMMEGEIRVESVPGKGSCFEIDIPFGRVSDEDRFEKAKASVKKDLKGTRILVAEDNPVNQMLIKKMLDQLQCETDLAADGLEVLLRLREKTYDVCFMDLQMPELGGVEAAEKIRRELKCKIPIIALTAAVMSNEQESCLRAGMNDFLTKPVKTEKLREVIVKWAGKESPL